MNVVDTLDVISNPLLAFIPKNEFDFKYYSENNSDLMQAGVNDNDMIYKHWILNGCRESRPVKSIKTGQCFRVKLNRKFDRLVHEHAKYANNNVLEDTKISDKSRSKLFPSLDITKNIYTPHTPHMFVKNTQLLSAMPITLQFNIAIMIHLYDIRMIKFFTGYLNRISKTYSNENFDIYVNVINENNPYSTDVKQFMETHVRDILNPNVTILYNENRGGDIGGLLLLCKSIYNKENKEIKEYKYVIFVHSKTRAKWRKELCDTIFNLKFEDLSKTNNIGMIGCKKWVLNLNQTKHSNEFRRFKYHMSDLCETYKLDMFQDWKFIAGTMFLANINLINFILSHDVDIMYNKLNRLETIDVNWIYIVTNELKKDTKGTGNDLQYRVKYGKPLHPDYMIEHTYERILGLICKHIGLSVEGY